MIKAVALQAKLVTRAMMVAELEPRRKMRRCPLRSPSFPSIGSETAENSIGAVMTQAIVVSEVSSSRATSASETARIVNGKPFANMPESAAIRVQRWRVPAASSWARIFERAAIGEVHILEGPRVYLKRDSSLSSASVDSRVSPWLSEQSTGRELFLPGRRRRHSRRREWSYRSRRRAASASRRTRA